MYPVMEITGYATVYSTSYCSHYYVMKHTEFVSSVRSAAHILRCFCLQTLRVLCPPGCVDLLFTSSCELYGQIILRVFFSVRYQHFYTKVLKLEINDEQETTGIQIWKDCEKLNSPHWRTSIMWPTPEAGEVRPMLLCYKLLAWLRQANSYSNLISNLLSWAPLLSRISVLEAKSTNAFVKINW